MGWQREVSVILFTHFSWRKNIPAAIQFNEARHES